MSELVKGDVGGEKRCWLLGTDTCKGSGEATFTRWSFDETGCGNRCFEIHCFRWSTKRLPTAELRPGSDKRNVQASVAHWLNPAYKIKIIKKILKRNKFGGKNENTNNTILKIYFL